MICWIWWLLRFGSTWIDPSFSAFLLKSFGRLVVSLLMSVVEAQVFLTALRPGPVDIWVEAQLFTLGIPHSSAQWLHCSRQHVARVRRSALTRGELEDVHFSQRGV